MHAARAGAIHIAFDVALHAVGDAILGAGQLVKEPAGPDAPVGIHIERAESARDACRSHTEFFRRARMRGHSDTCNRRSRAALLCRRGQPEHAHHVEIPLHVLRDHAGNYEPTPAESVKSVEPSERTTMSFGLLNFLS